LPEDASEGSSSSATTTASSPAGAGGSSSSVSTYSAGGAAGAGPSWSKAAKKELSLDDTEGKTGVVPAYMWQEILESFQDDTFCMELMKWSFKYCDEFPDDDPVDVEQKLEWTQLHVDYRRKFEDRANAVLANAGYDVDQVILELTKFVKNPIGFKLEADEDAITGVLDSLTASEDYIKFVRHMQSVKQRKAWARQVMGDEAFEESGFFG